MFETVAPEITGRRSRLILYESLPVSLAVHGVDRKSTRLNSSHLVISYAVFCLKKKKELIFLTIIGHQHTIQVIEVDVSYNILFSADSISRFFILHTTMIALCLSFLTECALSNV